MKFKKNQLQFDRKMTSMLVFATQMFLDLYIAFKSTISFCLQKKKKKAKRKVNLWKNVEEWWQQ